MNIILDFTPTPEGHPGSKTAPVIPLSLSFKPYPLENFTCTPTPTAIAKAKVRDNYRHCWCHEILNFGIEKIII